MRTFTEISDDRLLAAVPAAGAETFLDRLNVTCAANDEMQSFYQGHKEAFT